MSAISWDETAPAATSAASSGDDALRSFMSSVALGLQPAFYWPGSGGGSTTSAGQSQPGNMRMVVASSVATRADNGFLELNSSRVAVEHIGTWIGPLGHSNMLHMSSSTTAGGGLSWPQSSYWLMQNSVFTVNPSVASGSSFTKAISFASTYLGVPAFVSISILDGGFGGIAGLRGAVAVQAGSITSTGFTAVVSSTDASSTGYSITWHSLGTVSF